MDWEDFFRGLKGTDKNLLYQLDELRKILNLKKLYLICTDNATAVWGLRAIDGKINELLAEEKLQEFIREKVGQNYKLVLCLDEYSEVEFLLRKNNFIYEPEYANENTGVIILNILDMEPAESTNQKGIENILIHLLPWVKKVEFSNN